MRIFAFAAAAAACCVISPALAEADIEKAARAELRVAAEKAATLTDARFAFTATLEDITKEGARPLSFRFDPRRPEGARWSAVSPAADQLTKDEKKALEGFQKRNDADETIVYDDLVKSLEDATFLSGDASVATFSLPIDDEDMPKEARSALDATLRFNRALGFVEEVRVVSKRPFKPAAVAKVERMEQVQRYAPQGANGPVMLVEMRSLAKGKAMMKSFDQSIVIAYSAIEAVEAPTRAKPTK
jgi:hypothetical protein